MAPISPELVDRALVQIRKRRANYDYFFERLSSPQWIEPLRANGLFSDPPATEASDGGIRAQAWPPSEYLVRVAGQAPEEVAAVILGIDTDNERVHSDFLDAATELPVPIARPLILREIKWILTQEQFYFGLPEHALKLMKKLVDEGEGGLALSIMRALFRPSKRAEGEAPIDDESVSTRMSRWEYAELLSSATNLLTQSVPLDLLKYLTFLANDIAPKPSADVGPVALDLSQVWRPRLEADQRNDQDTRQAVASALRDAATTVRTEQLLTDEEVLNTLFAVNTPLPKRVAAFAALEGPEPSPSDLSRVLVDKSSFFSPEPSHEYRKLMEKTFGRLGTTEQQTLYSWIDEGPDLEAYVSASRERGETLTQVDLEEYAAKWRIRRLHLLRAFLPPDRMLLLSSLVGKFGESEFITSFEITTWWGPETPVELESLRASTDDQVVELLRGYTAGSSEWFGPSAEGLARTLSSLAEQEPARVSALLPKLTSLRPIYSQWALIGLTKAVQDDEPLNWPPVLDFLQHIFQSEDTENVGADDDNQGSWPTVRREAAGLLETSFQKRGSAVPFEARASLWSVLENLCTDPDPSPAYEDRFGGSNMDPVTVALNSTRGRAVRAVVAYALWVARSQEQSAVSFSDMPEVEHLLDRHLDPASETSPAVRSIYGQYFPWLARLDERWAASATTRIFDDSVLGDAAWTAYIMFCQPYESAYRLLQQQYARAVEHINEQYGDWNWFGAGPDKPAERLSEHLLVFYLRGVIGLDDESPLNRLFRIAPIAIRASAVDFVGRVLEDNPTLDDATTQRARAFWEWRSSRFGNEPAAAKRAEAAEFGPWLASSQLDREWRITQAEVALNTGASFRSEANALAGLRDLASSYPTRSVRALRAILNRATKSWIVTANRQAIEEVLRLALSSDQTSATESAHETIDWLGSRGFHYLGDMVRRRPASDTS
ncbi:hypothetical protein ACQP00_49620 [Dactylosporangium sp. CS-047395]|uniref:hypothetical protein n=1 Tax=Dactylosporangium sp. CS-047395 TaxID=3239936 RepID=UPI003D8EDB55